MMAYVAIATKVTFICQSYSRAAEQPGFVIVCEDAGGGGYEAFPDVCRLKDGRLMCVFYAGDSHVTLPSEKLPMGGQIVRCYSSDEGRTWSSAEKLFDGPNDDRDPSISQLSCGLLICNFFSLKRGDEPTKSYKGAGTWYITSSDSGKTWSEPKTLAGDDFYTSSPVRELSNGRLIVGLYRATDEQAQGAVTVSDDRAISWSSPYLIDGGGLRLDAETDVIELKDGRLLAALRGDGTTPMCWSHSRDQGQTWSIAKPIGFLGHCPYLHRTADGAHVLLAHRQPATNLNISQDEGVTWSENIQVDERSGAYPSMVNLHDGSVLIVYYEEGEGSNIRARRFRCSLQGIEWLPLDDEK